jgi:putative ABC transport system permease protein
VQDLRQAVRALGAAPVVSLVTVLSLALGIGANTAIFSVVNSLLLRPLPVADPQQLVSISSDRAIGLGFKAGPGWSFQMWNQLRQHAEVSKGDRSFAGALAWSAQRFDLAERGEMQEVDGLVTSGGFFDTLGVRARLGRTFTAADDVPGGGPDGPVVVISDRLWRRRFGGAADVVGTRLLVERVPFTIIGVTPPGFFGVEVGRGFDVAMPLGAEPLIRGDRAALVQSRSFQLFVLLRLKPGQSLGAATAEIRALQPHVLGSSRVPQFLKEPFTLVPAAAGTDIPASARPRYERPILTILVVVALILLIACANIANLALARATVRRHELSVRLAVGAPRWRLARQLLVESLVLAGIGGLAGLLFAAWGAPLLVARLSATADRLVLDLPLGWRVFMFTAAITIVTAILFGTAPAVRAARVDPVGALKGAGRTGASTGTNLRASSGLVIAQVALSLVLVFAAGLFVRTFQRLANVPLGFDGDRVLLVNVETARATIEAADRLALYRRLVEACAAVPGVAHAAGSRSTPVSAGLAVGVVVSGAKSAADSERLVLANAVTPGWFAAYGTPLRDGRDFDGRDTASAPAVVVVNDAFVRRFLPGRRALGETVDARTVIGVVGDQVVQGGYNADGTPRSLRDEAPPEIYVPLAQSAGLGVPGKTDINISVRSTAGPPALLARSVGAALIAVDGNLAFTFRPLADALSASIARERLLAMLSALLGALALLLAGLGLYGVMSYAVSRRRTELGIRLALGAAPRAVVRLVLARVALLVGAGVVAGTAASLWLSRFVAPLLYDLHPRDPVTLMAAALTLAAVGVLAAWLPARRASRIDPAQLLRDL